MNQETSEIITSALTAHAYTYQCAADGFRFGSATTPISITAKFSQNRIWRISDTASQCHHSLEIKQSEKNAGHFKTRCHFSFSLISHFIFFDVPLNAWENEILWNFDNISGLLYLTIVWSTDASSSQGPTLTSNFLCFGPFPRILDIKYWWSDAFYRKSLWLKW